MKSRGLLNPPFLFIYCLYFRFCDTFMAYALTDPSTFLPFVLSKEPKPMSFIISISSSVFPSRSSAAICLSLATFESLPSFFSSSCLPGEEEEDLTLRGDLERRLWGDRERLLRLSLDLERSRLLLSRSLDADLERLRSLRLSGDLLRLRPIFSAHRNHSVQTLREPVRPPQSSGQQHV